ncbi:hypothetical protein GCM10010271_68790 [Streptomyces kurssanovii]|nr:hypothetical protein GCM10010271_68790 [Streptomyces kurssanovii]
MESVTDDSDFAELMRRSSLGAPAARSTLERVPAERAETVRQITSLRHVIAHSTSTHEGLAAAIELVNLLRSLGFSWREELPEEMLFFALHRASASLAEEVAHKDLAKATVHTDRLASDARAAAAKVQRPAQQTDEEGRGETPVERPLDEAKFLTVAEVASLMRVSQMTVYRYRSSACHPQRPQLPCQGAGRARLPAAQVRSRPSHCGLTRSAESARD